MAGMTNLDAERELWYACAGPLVQIPAPNSLVYYFMQGHLEQTCRSLNMSDLGFQFTPSNRILCRVESVSYLATPVTNQVLAKFILTPLLHRPPISPEDSLDHNPALPDMFQIYPDDVIRSSVMEPALHKQRMLDLHHNLRECRIITIGSLVFVDGSWDELLNQIGVVEGDSILMINDRVGVLKRKIMVANNGLEIGFGWDALLNMAYLVEVSDAVLSAENNESFEAYYFPRLGPEFVVKAATVEAAMEIPWKVGMRCSMQYEDQYNSLVHTCSCIISSVRDVDHTNWPDSQWRRLQILTDHPHLSLNKTLVNPWMLNLQVSGESSSNVDVCPEYEPSNDSEDV